MVGLMLNDVWVIMSPPSTASLQMQSRAEDAAELEQWIVNFIHMLALVHDPLPMYEPLA